jgi:hypothetical protein
LNGRSPERCTIIKKSSPGTDVKILNIFAQKIGVFASKQIKIMQNFCAGSVEFLFITFPVFRNDHLEDNEATLKYSIK